MLTNQTSTTGLEDDTRWTALYERAAEESGEYVSEVRRAVEYGLRDPEDSVEMACAAAETTEAVVTALSDPWSLYTPQDAATVASAVFVQLQYSADALDELGRAVERIAERGETRLPVRADAEQTANLADALESLRAVSDTIHGLVTRHASTTVHDLHITPGSAPLPNDHHETVVAVARLLTEQHEGAVTLNTLHEEGAYKPDDGFGCGCDVTIRSGSEKYNFHRGNSKWVVNRDSDGLELLDGSMIYDTEMTLSTALGTAHPQQLVDDVLRIISVGRS
ncbi:hypothetical protein GT043_15020 [Streptomyces sp. SID2131]|nr:hypothetical protein [Streptomyces sp. SID2131]